MKSANLLIVILFFFALTGVNAQDLHFSQIGYSPLNLNPALTGVFEGDHRFTANARGQWDDTPDDSPLTYRTLSLAYDMSFINKNYRKRFFSGGFLFNYDVAGDSRLTLANLGLTGSYTHRITNGVYLSAGAMVGYNNRSFDMSDLQFDRQYDKETSSYNSNIDPQESFLSNPSVHLWDVSGGINIHYRIPKKYKRHAFDLGVGFLHFNEPERPFLSEDDTEVLPLRKSYYGLGTIHILDKWDVLANATYQDQGLHSQTVLGLGLQYHHNLKETEELSFNFGVNRRLGDTWIPMAGIRHKTWKATLSYDWNTSPYRSPSLGRRGYELSLIYIWSEVKEVPTKICPVYL